MVAYSFQRQFAPPILSGRKLHTIRGNRARHARVGEAVQLYTGMRTRACRKIGDGVCWAVPPILLVVAGDYEVALCRRRITCVAGLDRFAQRDGFRDWDEMIAFWHRQHPEVRRFEGVMICWRDFVAAAGAEAIG